MRPLSAASSALIVVDVQKAWDEIEATGSPRNNPHALAQIVKLMTVFRHAGVPLIHIRHASHHPQSPFRPDRPGYAVKDEVREWPGEPVIVKHDEFAEIVLTRDIIREFDNMRTAAAAAS
jgi:nicotinamidase-related amidase